MSQILIAEDEPSVREFLTRALKGAGFAVDAAADGSEALSALATASERGRRYDMLLTDILMPVMDGISLALTASQRVPEMKIMLMTGYSDQRERAHGLDAIIDDILLKPFTLEELTSRVTQTLAPAA
ncbi:MAG: response regulator [Rhizobiales bacterium]|nr:response regulator [Hyphomicrobiales bacterium]